MQGYDPVRTDIERGRNSAIIACILTIIVAGCCGLFSACGPGRDGDLPPAPFPTTTYAPSTPDEGIKV